MKRPIILLAKIDDAYMYYKYNFILKQHFIYMRKDSSLDS
jgi:hypothetical protein